MYVIYLYKIYEFKQFLIRSINCYVTKEMRTTEANTKEKEEEEFFY